MGFIKNLFTISPKMRRESVKLVKAVIKKLDGKNLMTITYSDGSTKQYHGGSVGVVWYYFPTMKRCAPDSNDFLEGIWSYIKVHGNPYPSAHMTDTDLLNLYERGFKDGLAKTIHPRTYDTFLEERAYDVGRMDALVGDDVSSSDFQSEEEIIKSIREYGKTKL